jgi:hypothetical protein
MYKQNLLLKSNLRMLNEDIDLSKSMLKYFSFLIIIVIIFTSAVLKRVFGIDFIRAQAQSTRRSIILSRMILTQQISSQFSIYSPYSVLVIIMVDWSTKETKHVSIRFSEGFSIMVSKELTILVSISRRFLLFQCTWASCVMVNPKILQRYK